MKKRLFRSLVIILLMCGLSFGADVAMDNWYEAQIDREKESEHPPIAWVLNADGTYTFSNEMEIECECLYAWQVLDTTGTPIFKTKYTEDNTLVFDLEDDRTLSVKSYVRIGTEDDYEQIVASVEASVVLGRKEYEIVQTKKSKALYTAIDEMLLRYANQGDAASVAEVMSGTVWGGIDISLPVDWSCTGVENRSYCFRINGLIFLDSLYAEYLKTGNRQYRKAIMDYVIDWAEQNQNITSEDDWAWNDDATARRVLRMSYYYDKFKWTCTREERHLIKNSLYKQANLLMKEEFYTAKHNHGMHQDLGLLIYALLLGNKDKREDYIGMALERTGEYLDYVYAEDGIHKEHSPMYAADIAMDMMWLSDITNSVSPEFANKLGDLVQGTREYLAQITKPNQTWPSIGDSSEARGADIKEFTDKADKFFANDDSLKHKLANEIVYPEGGYGIMRSSWEDKPEDATWMMLLASTFSSTHKHGDDLSFLLYHKGDLFVEAGKRDYNYANPMTAWAYSPYAHNVLLVNGEGFPVKIGENGYQSIYPAALETGITAYDFSGDIKTVTGVQKRFENVEQYRTLAYDKQNAIVTVADRLEVKENIQATFIYHIAEGVKVEECENGWNLYRNGALVANIEVKSKNKITLSTVTDTEGEYPYYTWIFSGKTEPKNGSILLVDGNYETGTNELELIINLK